MKDRGSNLEELLKGLLSIISNDRIVLFQTPQGRTKNNVSIGGYEDDIIFPVLPGIERTHHVSLATTMTLAYTDFLQTSDLPSTGTIHPLGRKQQDIEPKLNSS